MIFRKILACVILTILAATPVLAQTVTFRDVPASHFAFEAINWVSDSANGAFMVGDAANNFHPSRHLNKFDAAQIFAMAAGFRHVTHGLPEEERAVFVRSFDEWRPFLETMANQYATWNGTVNREIAFLLYRGILTMQDVQGFVSQGGTEETRPLITRQQAIVWMVRLMGQATQARAIALPHAQPFADDAQISPAYRPYVYHARDLGIIRGDALGNMNPSAHFTRAEMATVFHNARGGGQAAQAQAPEQAASAATVSGTIASATDDSVTINTASGQETFPFTQNAVLIVDNAQRTASALSENMTATVLVNPARQVISLTARSPVIPPAAPAPTLYADEGFITAVTAVPTQSITIRTQRVRITGQIMDEERTFTFAPDATITRGGVPTEFSGIQVGDIAFFGFSQTAIHTLDLMERERVLNGVLHDVRPPYQGTGPIFILEQEDGRVYELRVQATTEISRDDTEGLNWDDLRIGDAITAEVEFDRINYISAEGTRGSADGRLNEIRITERNTEITMTGDAGSVSTFIIRPGVLDVYTLRIGMRLRVALDSREVTGLQTRADDMQPAVVLGFIQSIRADGTIIVAEGTAAAARTHTLTIPANATITRGGANLAASNLRTNMNVYVILTAPDATTVSSITILP